MRRLTVPFLLTLLLGGWVRPQLPTSARPVPQAKARLDYVTIEVRGETKVVRAGEELALVVGDVFTVRDAFLVDKTQRPGEVNVLGFSHGQRKVRASEDRGQAIDTAGALLKVRWSEGGQGQVYAIATQTGNELHGTVFVRLLEPVLRYAEVSINGKPRTMRDGEALSLRRSDKLKVHRVVTNLQDDAGVVFQIVEQVAAGGGPPVEPGRYEIRFLRSGRRFASIPLKVVD